MIKQAVEILRKLPSDIQEQLGRRLGPELVETDGLKMLLAVVALILFLSGLLAVSHWNASVLADYRAKHIALARLKTQVETRLWPERKAQSEALKLALEERLWTAETPGLAEASYERWLRDHLARYKIDPQSVQVHRVPLLTSADPSDRGSRVLASMERMTAKVMMPFNQNGLLGFLDDIAEGDKLVIIDRIVVRAGRNARIEMDVSTFFPTRGRS